MLWLALYWPSLGLDAWPDLQTATSAAVVAERQGGRQLIIAANPVALAAGIAPGCSLSAAQALSGELHWRWRDPALELERLQALADWAQQFTPCVCLDPAPAILLEIGSCLEYFKGLPALRQRIETGLQTLNLQLAQGCAATPLAALWRARHGAYAALLDNAAVRTALADLPLPALGLDADKEQALAQFGLHRLGDILQLPRAGLTRRLGGPLLNQLDRALGRCPDPRQPYLAPERFRRRLELGWPAEQSEALFIGGQRLLLELSGFLAARGLGVTHTQWLLEHDDLPASPLELGFARSTGDGAAMAAVLRERLNQYQLAAPVRAMVLSAPIAHPLQAINRDLFSDEHGEDDLDLLRARLTARLGEEALCSVTPVADHRPEKSWVASPLDRAAEPLPFPPRPLWLLPQARVLSVHEHRPWYGGPLHILSRAERLEGGWWDGEAMARDYVVAEGSAGQRYWLYQDRQTREWHLHGIFDGAGE